MLSPNPKHKNLWHFIYWRFVRGIMSGYLVAVFLRLFANDVIDLTIQFWPCHVALVIVTGWVADVHRFLHSTVPNLPHILLSNARHNTLLIQLFIVIKSFICTVSFWNRVVVVVSLWSFQLETQFSVSCFIYGMFITLLLGLHLTVFIVWIVEVDRVLPTIWVETVKFHCPMHAITHRWFNRLLLEQGLFAFLNCTMELWWLLFSAQIYYCARIFLDLRNFHVQFTPF